MISSVPVVIMDSRLIRPADTLKVSQWVD